MPPKTRVIVCGSSLYMASLAAGLRADGRFEVTRIATRISTSADCFRDRDADVIAFDLVELPVDLPVALLRDHPDLLLLGMDPTSEELLVLSGHHAQALSVADLGNIIARSAGGDSALEPASSIGDQHEEAHPS